MYVDLYIKIVYIYIFLSIRMSRDTRKCIKDFVRHVEALEAEEDPEGNGFNREYRVSNLKQYPSLSICTTNPIQRYFCAFD